MTSVYNFWKIFNFTPTQNGNLQFNLQKCENINLKKKNKIDRLRVLTKKIDRLSDGFN